MSIDVTITKLNQDKGDYNRHQRCPGKRKKSHGFENLREAIRRMNLVLSLGRQGV